MTTSPKPTKDEAIQLVLEALKTTNLEIHAKAFRAVLKAIAQPAADDKSVLQLSELMRGLEIPPTAATMEPGQLFFMGQAIARQAKAAADDKAGGEPSGWRHKRDGHVQWRTESMPQELCDKYTNNPQWEPIYTRPQPQADYDRGWNDGYKHGAWASKPQAEKPAERVGEAAHGITAKDQS